MNKVIEKAILDKTVKDPDYCSIPPNNLIIDSIKLRHPFIGSFGHSPIYKLRLIVKNKLSSVAVKFSEKDEYENLIYLWENHYKNQKRNRIPKPFFYSEEHKLLFFEFIEGDNLNKSVFMSAIYFSKKSDFNKTQDIILDSVDWLTDFEEKSFSNKYISTDKHYEEITYFISSSTVFTNKTKTFLNKKLELLCKDIDRIPIKFSNKGFRMRDILSNREGIIRLDWGNWRQRKEHLIFLELSTFLVELREMCILPYINKRKIEIIEKIFVERYWNQTTLSTYKNLYYLSEFSYLVFYLNSLLNKIKHKEKRLINKMLIRRRIDLVKKRIIHS